MRPGITVPLSKPVVVLGQRYEALTLRPLKRRDLGAVASVFKSEMGVLLTARLAGVPAAVIVALDDPDDATVGAAVNAMLDQVL